MSLFENKVRVRAPEPYYIPTRALPEPFLGLYLSSTSPYLEPLSEPSYIPTPALRNTHPSTSPPLPLLFFRL